MGWGGKIKKAVKKVVKQVASPISKATGINQSVVEKGLTVVGAGVLTGGLTGGLAGTTKAASNLVLAKKAKSLAKDAKDELNKGLHTFDDVVNSAWHSVIPSNKPISDALNKSRKAEAQAEAEAKAAESAANAKAASEYQRSILASRSNASTQVNYTGDDDTDTLGSTPLIAKKRKLLGF